jgi:hypothetical protein
MPPEICCVWATRTARRYRHLFAFPTASEYKTDAAMPVCKQAVFGRRFQAMQSKKVCLGTLALILAANTAMFAQTPTQQSTTPSATDSSQTSTPMTKEEKKAQKKAVRAQKQAAENQSGAAQGAAGNSDTTHGNGSASTSDTAKNMPANSMNTQMPQPASPK